LFAFIDPFGLPIPFEMVRQILSRGGSFYQGLRVGGAPTEILLNFSVHGINRVGGQLTGKGTDLRRVKARDTTIAAVDGALGGDWWQPIWRSEAHDRVDRILDGYRARLLDLGHDWGMFTIPVSDRWMGSPAYHLLFMTQHPDGLWAFNESVSSAMEEYRRFCHESEGRMDFELLAEREAKWCSAISDNIKTCLKSGRFRLDRRIADVYGETLGYAREKHVRKALRALHEAGDTPTDCAGEKRLSRLIVVPP
jgi:hypothetical protein